jgi:hypothetical protein
MMTPIKVRIADISSTTKWYKKMQGMVFDVIKKPGGNYRLIDTEANEKVLRTEPDDYVYSEFVKRMRTPYDIGSIGLGISRGDAVEIVPDNNKGASTLLDKEW